VVEACARAGLEVPREVCVLGTNNHELICEHCYPTLSSIVQSSRRIGYHAAELLDRLMDGETAPPPMRIQPRNVVMRESTDRFVTEDEDVAAALRFIRNNAAKPIVVDDILNVLPISRRLLEMKFRRVTGKAPAQEIRHAHIERAKKLLKETDWSISRISMSSGYDSLHGFLLAFKRETRCTPGQYRAARTG
jgi:LacI family transcriptional regulator